MAEKMAEVSIVLASFPVSFCHMAGAVSNGTVGLAGQILTDFTMEQYNLQARRSVVVRLPLLQEFCPLW